MKMVTGGAFEGKTSYAMRVFGLRDADIVDGSSCSRYDLFHTKAVKHAEQLVKRCLREGDDVLELADQLIRLNPGIIVIVKEIGCGVIPVDPADRNYRELTGRFCTKLASYADEVHRVTYGQGIVIKKAEGE